MGNILKIPSYVYFGEETIYQKFIIYTSDTLFNKVINQEINYTFSGSILNGDLKQLVNTTLGERVVSNDLEPVITLRSGESVDIDSKVVESFGLSYQVLRPSNNAQFPTKMATLNSFELVNPIDVNQTNALVNCGQILTNRFWNFGCFGNSEDNTIRVFGSGLNELTMQLRIPIYPSNIFENGVVNANYLPEGVAFRVLLIGAVYDLDAITLEPTCKFLRITTDQASDSRIITCLTGFNTAYAMIQESDTTNPYAGGDSDPNSTTGGGDGTYENIDGVDATDVPELPSLSAAATGFITLYNPSSSVLSSLGNFLWSGMFDIDTFKKMFAEPMNCIIGLGIVPVLPSSAGAQNIKFGNVDTEISCNVLASQYASKDCGSVSIKKYIGSFMDYSPYVKISLFLPYIGFVNLGTDDIIGGSINVKYNIDVLSGDCIAFIKHSDKGVLYSYHGNCLTNIPVTSQNYANALQHYYESVAGIIPSTTNGAANSGVAGAIGGAVSGTISAASNIVLNSKPSFQRSSNIGGSAGILGVQKPFIIIERPNISVPSNVQHYIGQTCNITMPLSSCRGFTLVDSVHLNGINATSTELAEIESLLKEGVIL